MRGERATERGSLGLGSHGARFGMHHENLPRDEYRRGVFEVFFQGLDHGRGIIAIHEAMIE